jgi:probable F420-dependent oxidoreductase
MRIGLQLLYPTPAVTGADAALLAKAAEERRFATLWRGEHVVNFPSYKSAYPYASQSEQAGQTAWTLRPDTGFCDSFLQLMFFAAHTTQIRLGTGICIVPQRNPLYTAKQVTAIDYLSNGRFNFGVGLGWSREEYSALNVRWEGRGKRMDEYLELMKRLWIDHDSEYHGETYDMPICRQYPKPLQKPHPPIYIGGEGDPALARVAKHGDGWFGMGQRPDQIRERLSRLDGLLAEQGRERSSVQVAIAPYFKSISRSEAEDYAATGIDELILMYASESVKETLNMFDYHANLVELTREDERGSPRRM